MRRAGIVPQYASLVFLFGLLSPGSVDAQAVLDEGIALALDAAVALVQKKVTNDLGTFIPSQSRLTGPRVKCFDFGESTVAMAYFGRIRVGNKHGGTQADENGGTINLCFPIALPAEITTRLSALGIVNVPTVSSQEQISDNENQLDVQCSGNRFIINYRHSGDENGTSTYECGRIKVGKDWQLLWGIAHRGGQRQSKVGSFGCGNIPGILMFRAEHYGDENGFTYFTCTIPKITAPYSGANGLFSDQGLQVANALLPVFGKSTYKELLGTSLAAASAAQALDLIKTINTDADLASLPALWQNPFRTDLLSIFGSSTTHALFRDRFGVTDLTTLIEVTLKLKALEANWNTSHQTLANAAAAVGLASVNALLYATYPVPTLSSLEQLVASYSTTNALKAVNALLAGNLVAACGVPFQSVPLLLRLTLLDACP